MLLWKSQETMTRYQILLDKLISMTILRVTKVVSRLNNKSEVLAGQTHQLLPTNYQLEEFSNGMVATPSLKTSCNIFWHKKGSIILILVRVRVEIQSLVVLNTHINTDCTRNIFPKRRQDRQSTEEEQQSSRFFTQNYNGTIFVSSSGKSQKVSSTRIHLTSLKVTQLLQMKLTVDMRYFSPVMILTP